MRGGVRIVLVVVWWLNVVGFFSIAPLSFAADIKFSWEHDGSNVDGYHFYRGTSSKNLIRIATIPNKDTKSFTYSFTDKSLQYFGVSAYNALGESETATKNTNGELVRFGPPSSPIYINATQLELPK